MPKLMIATPAYGESSMRPMSKRARACAPRAPEQVGLHLRVDFLREGRGEDYLVTGFSTRPMLRICCSRCRYGISREARGGHLAVGKPVVGGCAQRQIDLKRVAIGTASRHRPRLAKAHEFVVRRLARQARRATVQEVELARRYSSVRAKCIARCSAGRLTSATKPARVEPR